jgi:N-acetylglucosamine kinase-like BadF-type ATPase
MGFLDHRKIWRFRVSGTPDQCVAAFAEAFSGSARVTVMGRATPNKVKANWSVQRRGNGAVAIYEGRAGILAAIGTGSSKFQANEQEAARGSEVTFEIEESGGGFTVCAMWLASKGTMNVGTTADARFIRPYMVGVETHLRSLDPALTATKG